MKRIILLTAIIGFVFTACKKDDDSNNGNDGPKYSQKQLDLTNGSEKGWVLDKLWIEGKTATGDSVNVDGSLDSCVMDNKTYFNVNGNYRTLSGTLKCDPNEDAEVTGTWGFIDEQRFRWNDDTLNFVSLTDKELKLSFVTRITGGPLGAIDALITSTYIPQ